MIATNVFIERMREHWTGRLGNVCNKGLERAWGMLSNALINLYASYDSPLKGKVFTVLPFSTGCGKTQGTIVYFSLLSQLPIKQRPGGLIITRRIADADDIAAEINRLSRIYNPALTGNFATAYHSENKTTVSIEDLSTFPVLVITHRAYELALERLGSEATIPRTWKYFYQYGETDTRKLVVIDEAIDLVEHFQLDPETLKELPRFMDGVRREFPHETSVIDAMIGLFEQSERISAKAQDKRAREAVLPSRPELFNADALPDFTAFRAALRATVRYDKLIPFGKEDAQERRRIGDIVDASIKALNALVRSWIYYAKVNTTHTLNTARLLIPNDRTMKGAVVLDATASCNVLYELFDGAEVMTPPPDMRSYRRVTLHASRGHNPGKIGMSADGDKMSVKLLNTLSKQLRGQDKSVFVVTHKGVEHHLKGYTADTLGFKQYAVDHFGNIDGSNAWKDYDTAVIFGLPYRPQTWSANVFMAFQGVQSTEWLRDKENRAFKQHKDIRSAIETGQIVTDVVQAINRIRCRRVIDVEGNCPTADVYLLLPSGKRGDAILQGVVKEMPGIRVDENWSLDVAKKKLRKTKHDDVLTSYFLNNMENGAKLSVSDLRTRLNIPTKSFKRLLDRIKRSNADDALIQSMQKTGVTYELQGERRPSYFKKTACS